MTNKLKTEVYTLDGTMLFSITENNGKWQLNPNSNKTRVRFEFDIKTRKLYNDVQIVNILFELMSKKTLEVSGDLEVILRHIEEFDLDINTRYQYNKLVTQIA